VDVRIHPPIVRGTDVRFRVLTIPCHRSTALNVEAGRRTEATVDQARLPTDLRTISIANSSDCS
jgi:hypothetical protein